MEFSVENLGKPFGADGGGRTPPLTRDQLERRLDIDDVERIIRALNPGGGKDPFGKIEDLILGLAERFEAEIKEGEEHRKDRSGEVVETNLYRKQADETRDDIKSRTFGILFLQILKTIKLLFGFLPQGRIILLVVAGIGLAAAIINNEPISLGQIREAVAKTGIADFIDKILAEIRKTAGELAKEVGDFADVASVIVGTSAAKLDLTDVDLSGVLGSLDTVLQSLRSSELNFSAEEGILRGIGERIRGSLENLDASGNALTNIETFILPGLRGAAAQIRELPDLANKLVRF